MILNTYTYDGMDIHEDMSWIIAYIESDDDTQIGLDSL